MSNLLSRQKSIKKLKSDCEITIRYPIAEWGESEMGIGVHRDDGNILSKGAGRSHIEICGFNREEAHGRNKDKSRLGGIPIVWDIGASLRGSTSSYGGEIQSAFRGFDTARFVKSTLSGLICGNENVAIETRMRNGKPIVVEHLRSINPITKERRQNGSRESNIEKLEANPWLALSHIEGPLNIPDEMPKSATQTKLILQIFRNISQTVSDELEDEIRKTYPAGMQYLAFPGTEEGRRDSGAIMRRRAVLDSWEMVKRLCLLLIKNCIIEDQNAK